MIFRGAVGGSRHDATRETRISAGHISPCDAEHFGLGLDAMVLIAMAIDVDMDDGPVQSIRMRFAADRMELVVESKSLPF